MGEAQSAQVVAEGLTITQMIIGLAVFGVMLALAALYLKSGLVKQNTSELERLVETRGKRIDDQDELIHQQDMKIEELMLKIENQQGQIDIIRAQNTQIIIDGVDEGLRARGMTGEKIAALVLQGLQDKGE